MYPAPSASNRASQLGRNLWMIWKFSKRVRSRMLVRSLVAPKGQRLGMRASDGKPEKETRGGQGRAGKREERSRTKDRQAGPATRPGGRAGGGRGGRPTAGFRRNPAEDQGKGEGGEREREGREGSRERRGREEGKRPEGRGARCAVGERTLEPTTAQRAGARRSQERRSRQPARSIGTTIRTVRAQGARKVPQVASLRLSLVPVPFDATGG